MFNTPGPSFMLIYKQVRLTLPVLFVAVARPDWGQLSGINQELIQYHNPIFQWILALQHVEVTLNFQIDI